MKWITLKSLQREFGLPWMVCEQIIREQVRLVSKRRLQGALIGGLFLAGFMWAVLGADWLLPSVHGWRRVAAEVPGLVLAFFARLVLPRLLAGEAILAAAWAHASQQQSTGITTP